MFAVAAVLALGVAGCGGDDDSTSEQPAQNNTAPQEAKKGGDLTVMYAGDVDNIDPGITYYQYGFNIAYVTQRPLYSFKPDDAINPEPDLAEGPPEISDDGKTLTVKIRTGVKFSPPVNREVTTKDVKYAIERAFTKTVNGPYVGAYMSDIDGVKEFQDGKAKEISGITTPDDQTIVFKLSRPRAAIVAGALALPVSAPVPKEYAQKFDNVEGTSKYGNNQVFTGPYMIENDESGKLTGYTPGTVIKLVRNPNWDESTDYRPAYADSITIKEGNDAQVASRQILEGENMVSGDFQLPGQILSRASSQNKDQLVLTPPTGRFRYIALKNTTEPFNDLNVRKALSAAFDRDALRKAFGGELVGKIPTHWIPPGQPGYDEAGGDAGPGVDFLKSETGDLELAKEYMKKAGFESGMYDGGKTFSGVSDNATQQKAVAETVVQQVAKLGFKVDMKYVTRDAMYTKYCQVPRDQPDVCPSVGWLKDFADAETLLDPVFNGKNILDVGNSNFSLLDNPETNKLMDDAEVVNDPDQRNQAWGEVDKAITEQAPSIPWLWDTQPMLVSKNVAGVVNQSNASFDLAFTSLK
ncbi:MAG TPA: ABC transporter substrate-binding protein [Solirubrobacteraceae bacterium]|nr:ABC transporter substrate-binding protein [Solirubrobacteraceae bacterium]